MASIKHFSFEAQLSGLIGNVLLYRVFWFDQIETSPYTGGTVALRNSSTRLKLERVIQLIRN